LHLTAESELTCAESPPGDMGGASDASATDAVDGTWQGSLLVLSVAQPVKSSTMVQTVLRGLAAMAILP